jgi:hypothetical protein
VPGRCWLPGAAPLDEAPRARVARDTAAARAQRLDRSRLWPRLGGGWHCARDTVAAIEAAGFGVERVRRFDLGATWMHTNPHVLGVARLPA